MPQPQRSKMSTRQLQPQARPIRRGRRWGRGSGALRFKTRRRTLLEQKSAEFIAIGAAEIGGASGWYGFNVMLAAGMLREAAAMTTQIGGEVIPSNVPGCLSMAVRQPAGVVLGIAPWNAPVILGVRAIAMPLACGNTVVLKASEICPGLHPADRRRRCRKRAWATASST